ncbi:hypothetical protein QYE76_055460 [Lolium multiflorum]|uniref:EF-hand domain-containing protein n=1 Tax=Lolium multiflorum TaxID=4521 RepID=A0AAD8WMB6_LOLMU|nr:hypothetical protein QYE76_055460 [Lolium multiflorum]
MVASAKFRRVFAAFDQDGDGKISEAELRLCMKAALGGDMPQNRRTEERKNEGQAAAMDAAIGPHPRRAAAPATNRLSFTSVVPWRCISGVRHIGICCGGCRRHRPCFSSAPHAQRADRPLLLLATEALAAAPSGVPPRRTAA